MTTLHGTDITLVGIHPSFQAITSFSILQSEGITTVSQFLKDETVRDFGVAADDIEVIPNFLDTDVYGPGKEPCHRDTLAQPGEKIVMHVSNFRPVKCVADVVKVFAGVAERMPAPLDHDRRRARAASCDRGGSGHGRGGSSGLPRQARCGGGAPALCRPVSAAEPVRILRLAALEAMASGAPVVASNVGGLPEVVPHGEAGYLLEPGDVDAMTAGAIEILSDRTAGRRSARLGRAVAVERFSAELVVPVYEEYCLRVIETHRRNTESRVQHSVENGGEHSVENGGERSVENGG